ncbi:MAG: hypothetical protein LCH86_09920 [Proteobacteria bacterium]|nr:hypothetical protein [Pseudomonadota bacterium]
MNATGKHQAIGFNEAKRAIATGRARARALWVILTDEHQRDGYALKPSPWEGPGEYQNVSFGDGPGSLVRLPGGKSLKVPAIAKAEGH